MMIARSQHFWKTGSRWLLLRTPRASQRPLSACSATLQHHHWNVAAQSIQQQQQQQQQQQSSSRRYFSSLRLGLGSQQWSTIDKTEYQNIVHQAYVNGIPTIESGQEGGDALLAEALRSSIESNLDLKEPRQILLRVGYRIVNTQDSKTKLLFPQDVQIQQQEPPVPDFHSDEDENPQEILTVLHNIHAEYIKHILKESPLVQLSKDYPDLIKITVLLFNPEEQSTQLLGGDNATYETRQQKVRERLTVTFRGLQSMVEEQKIAGFGICSNGLGLPADHPLHLSWNDTVLPAAIEAAAAAAAANEDDTTANKFAFNVLQFPCNVMETTGIQLANEIKSSLSSSSSSDGVTHPAWLQNLQLYAMRPLSCYPDRGTGFGRPFILADQQLPATMEKSLEWSHTMTSLPAAYGIALKTALQHFDAQDILEKQATNGTEALSTEERETLDGCKLLQSLLHDLDAALANVRSYAQYEDELMTQIIPLIRDTFESYDEDTAAVLQSFFGAYNMAVKYSVAKNTRNLILSGEDGSGNHPKTTTTTTLMEGWQEEIQRRLTPDKRLQDFAVEILLQQTTKDNDNDATKKKKNQLLDKIIVGCTEAWQVPDLVDSVKKAS